MQADAASLTADQRVAQIAAVVASNGHVSTLSRSIRHLTTLLGQGSVRAAHEYRAMLDGLEGDVRRLNRHDDRLGPFRPSGPHAKMVSRQNVQSLHRFGGEVCA